MNRAAVVATLEVAAQHGPSAVLDGLIMHAEAALTVAPSLGVSDEDVVWLKTLRFGVSALVEKLGDLPKAP